MIDVDCALPPTVNLRVYVKGGGGDCAPDSVGIALLVRLFNLVSIATKNVKQKEIQKKIYSEKSNQISSTMVVSYKLET